MKENKKMNITIPETKSFDTMQDGKIQKGMYLQIPSSFRKDFLKEDIENGAVIYKEMQSELEKEHTSSRVSIINAPTREDGLRAVVHLAGIHALEDGFEFSDEESQSNNLFYAFDLEGEELWDADDDLLFGDDTAFIESYDKIPVIPISEGRNYIFMNTQDEATMGFFGMQMSASRMPYIPWWNNCKNEAVCILCNTGLDFAQGNIFDSMDWEVLNLFRDNRRVYVLLPNSSPLDSSIRKTMIEFTANFYQVDKNEETRFSYYDILLKETAEGYGFSFDSVLDLRAVTRKLVVLDRDNPCLEFNKVFRYLNHIGVSPRLKLSDLKVLGIGLSSEERIDEKTDIHKTLYGMDSVKNQINGFIHMLEYQKLLREKGIKNADFHSSLLFIGPPGTAKSTVAKYLANECLKKGLLKGNNFISLSGAQLKGAYVGQTAPKVHQVFSENDVIFIDEAYSLSENFMGENDVYAKEALAQIAIELEEHANDKLVIFAGYGGRKLNQRDNKMKNFLLANPGISSRIGITVYFDSYDCEHMVNIVHKLAELDSLSFSHRFDDKVRKFFETRLSAPDFGNGREARVFLEQCKMHLADRVAGKKDPSLRELKSILAKDVDAAIHDLEDGNEERSGKSVRKTGLI